MRLFYVVMVYMFYCQCSLQRPEITLPDSCCNCSAAFNTRIETMMKHFNRTCQTFTAINAFKYQLQHYLFHGHNNTTLLQNLTSIVTGLQGTARYLQQIAIIEVITPSMHYHGHYINCNNVITGYSVYEVHS